MFYTITMIKLTDINDIYYVCEECGRANKIDRGYPSKDYKVTKCYFCDLEYSIKGTVLNPLPRAVKQATKKNSIEENTVQPPLDTHTYIQEKDDGNEKPPIIAIVVTVLVIIGAICFAMDWISKSNDSTKMAKYSPSSQPVSQESPQPATDNLSQQNKNEDKERLPDETTSVYDFGNMTAKPVRYYRFINGTLIDIGLTDPGFSEIIRKFEPFLNDIVNIRAYCGLDKATLVVTSSSQGESKYELERRSSTEYSSTSGSEGSSIILQVNSVEFCTVFFVFNDDVISISNREADLVTGE